MLESDVPHFRMVRIPETLHTANLDSLNQSRQEAFLQSKKKANFGI
jgi:hypothetical protein